MEYISSRGLFTVILQYITPTYREKEKEDGDYIYLFGLIEKMSVY